MGNGAGGGGSWSMPICAVLALLLLLLAAGGGRGVAAQMSCSQAVSALIPCGSYLIGQAGAPDPTPQCCQSAEGLVGMARTVEQRRQMCQCLKQTGPSFGVRPERASSLASFCKLSLSIPVSPDVDCNRVQ